MIITLSKEDIISTMKYSNISNDIVELLNNSLSITNTINLVKGIGPLKFSVTMSLYNINNNLIVDIKKVGIDIFGIARRQIENFIQDTLSKVNYVSIERNPNGTTTVKIPSVIFNSVGIENGYINFDITLK